MGGRRQLQAAVVVLLLLQSTQCIVIKHHGFQVQLESVKRMRELEGQQVFSPRLQAKSLLPSVCHNPDLPLDLQPICASQEAAGIFKALKTIADTDECELCENVACTGCG